ncbi:alpha-L-arabinofuranosidase C-terminal domain-containing protein [Anaerosporobacter sp.]|uniref:alpha-L-arabinofuranosidase C-terminal domain-containing protein n=1 Tax=Anaerosporobacter sp. TaxID=1872529 RepID=UPI00286F125C|nr:alpha-L-arabinofuranosidase C-terminal domain-containing protein [Anaerosporobacter sp.]
MKKHFSTKKITVFCCLMSMLLLAGCKKDHTNDQGNEQVNEQVNDQTNDQTNELEEEEMKDTNYCLQINGEKQGIDISDNLYGLFFEDINFAADGGLYAEKVINRSFEFDASLAENGQLHGYEVVNNAKLTICTEDALNKNNPSYVELTAESEDSGMRNKGFLEGMSFEKDEEYRFTVYIKSDSYKGKVKVALENRDGNSIGSAYIEDVDSSWEKKEIIIKAEETVEKGSLSLLLEEKGSVYMDMVSLFPVNTYKNRENGLRADMVKMLEELNPTFIRFPGGCIVEGNPLENAYNWKDTVGDVAQRKQNENLWIGTTKYPYYQTYGIGFYEYFLLCEDLGAQAVPIVNCGMSCQARAAGQTNTLAALNELDEYIQDALDLVEFCRGDASTTWGSVRIGMGHTEPFEITCIGIGNEQWGDEYFKRYEKFVQVFREKYPDIELISSSGPLSSGDLFDNAWKEINSHNDDAVSYADLVDEHYYNEPEWFLKNTSRYDSYDREGAGVFLGEYAAKSNTLGAAVAEAAYMTALERNSDIVKMAAYAPLFGNTLSSQWRPDMIWFNNSNVFGSVNYYVQKMFANNTGDYILESALEGVEGEGATGKVGVGTWKTAAVFDDIKVVDNETNEVLYENDFSEKDPNFEGSSQGIYEIIEEEDGNKVFAQTNASYPTNDAIMGSASYIGDTSWTNYTYTVRAKKLSGDEGFLIPFAVKDQKNFYHWNIGGWNNTRSVVEEALGGTKNTVSDIRNVNIQANRWYEIKVVVTKDTITCYLDEKEMHVIEVPEVFPVYQTVSKDEATGDIIVKLVNTKAEEHKVDMKLENCDITGEGTVEVLSGEDTKAENSIKNPENIVPVTTEIKVTQEYEYIAPANSVSIFRLKTNK